MKIKINHMDGSHEYLRDDKGKFTESKWKRKLNRIGWTLTWLSIIAFILYFGVSILISFIPEKTTAIEPERIKEVMIDTFPEHLDEIKADVIDRLQECESGGASEDDAIVKWDNNKSGTLPYRDIPSYGTMQWKVSTLKEFEKLRSGKELTNKEAILIALDDEKARELAEFAIFEVKGGVFRWKNCAEKLGLVEEVTIIKKLQNEN